MLNVILMIVAIYLLIGVVLCIYINIGINSFEYEEVTDEELDRFGLTRESFNREIKRAKDYKILSDLDIIFTWVRYVKGGI